jgi:hypothetical protein
MALDVELCRRWRSRCDLAGPGLPGEHWPRWWTGLVQTAWLGVWTMVWGPDAVAQFGEPAVMIGGRAGATGAVCAGLRR